MEQQLLQLVLLPPLASGIHQLSKVQARLVEQPARTSSRGSSQPGQMMHACE